MSTGLFCDACGKQNREQARFCGYCGKPLQTGKQDKSVRKEGVVLQRLLLVASILLAMNLAVTFFNIPPSRAGGTFQYKIFRIEEYITDPNQWKQQLTQILNQYGQDGWEVVDHFEDSGFIVLKKSM